MRSCIPRRIVRGLRSARSLQLRVGGSPQERRGLSEAASANRGPASAVATKAVKMMSSRLLSLTGVLNVVKSPNEAPLLATTFGAQRGHDVLEHCETVGTDKMTIRDVSLALWLVASSRGSRDRQRKGWQSLCGQLSKLANEVILDTERLKARRIARQGAEGLPDPRSSALSCRVVADLLRVIGCAQTALGLLADVTPPDAALFRTLDSMAAVLVEELAATGAVASADGPALEHLLGTVSRLVENAAHQNLISDRLLNSAATLLTGQASLCEAHAASFARAFSMMEFWPKKPWEGLLEAFQGGRPLDGEWERRVAATGVAVCKALYWHPGRESSSLVDDVASAIGSRPVPESFQGTVPHQEPVRGDSVAKPMQYGGWKLLPDDSLVWEPWSDASDQGEVDEHMERLTALVHGDDVSNSFLPLSGASSYDVVDAIFAFAMSHRGLVVEASLGFWGEVTASAMQGGWPQDGVAEEANRRVGVFRSERVLFSSPDDPAALARSSMVAKRHLSLLAAARLSNLPNVLARWSSLVGGLDPLESAIALLRLVDAGLPKEWTSTLRREARAMGLQAPTLPYPELQSRASSRGAMREWTESVSVEDQGVGLRLLAQSALRWNAPPVEMAWPIASSAMVVGRADEVAWRPVQGGADLSWVSGFERYGIKRWIEENEVLRLGAGAIPKLIGSPLPNQVPRLPQVHPLLAATSSESRSEPQRKSKTMQADGTPSSQAEIPLHVTAAAVTARNAVAMRREAEMKLLGAEATDTSLVSSVLGIGPGGRFSHSIVSRALASVRRKGGRKPAPKLTVPLPPLPDTFSQRTEKEWKRALDNAARERRVAPTSSTRVPAPSGAQAMIAPSSSTALSKSLTVSHDGLQSALALFSGQGVTVPDVTRAMPGRASRGGSTVERLVGSLHHSPMLLAAALLARQTDGLSPGAAEVVVSTRAAEATALSAALDLCTGLPPALRSAWSDPERVQATPGRSSAGDGGGISREEESYLHSRRRPLLPATRLRRQLIEAAGWYCQWLPYDMWMALPAARRRALFLSLLPERVRPMAGEQSLARA
jgi:hypothetical protein